MTAYFLVTSYGRTATTWLAHTLAQLDGVSVSHGPLPIPITTEGPKHPSVADQHRFLNELPKITLAQYLETLRQAQPDARVVGNVHAFTAGDLASRKNEKLPQPLGTMNITRHPITRVESFHRHWMREAAESPDYHAVENKNFYNSEFCQWISQRLPKVQDLSPESTTTFLRATATVLATDRSELELEPNQIMAMERLTREPEAFQSLLRLVTQDSIPIENSFIESAIESDAKNKSTGNTATSKQTWESWADWQRSAFRLTANALEVSLEKYQRLHYDLQFVGN